MGSFFVPDQLFTTAQWLARDRGKSPVNVADKCRGERTGKEDRG
jgi:hypothetical protein